MSPFPSNTLNIRIADANVMKDITSNRFKFPKPTEAYRVLNVYGHVRFYRPIKYAVIQSLHSYSRMSLLRNVMNGSDIGESRSLLSQRSAVWLLGILCTGDTHRIV